MDFKRGKIVLIIYYNMKINFKEDDIRPSIYKRGMERAREADLKYLDNKKNNFTNISCPACGLESYSFLFRKYNFDFVICKECETVFMNPRATEQILAEFYTQSKMYKYWNKHIFPASEKDRREKIVKPRVKRILDICEKFNIATNCLVEVGAGFGTFCEEVMHTKKFKNIIAIEPSVNLAESCQQKGIKIIKNSVENIKEINIKPNVVVSFEVIEHLFSPEFFLQNCYQLINPNSIIVITCPNFKGFDISTLGLVSDSIDAEHINLFNPTALKKLFVRCGFEVLECFTPGEIDVDIVRNKIMAGEYDVSKQPFLKTILINKWDKLGQKFQQFLQENNLSSHMWLVAKRKD